MAKIRLGKTELQVSPAGLGCGGHSRLGMRAGGETQAAIELVRYAVELGVNFFDTARVYGTEEVVGEALQHCRDDVVISTKTMFLDKDGEYLPSSKIVESLDKSLVRLKSYYVDIFSFHGVSLAHLEYCTQVYVPVLQEQVRLGKIRHIGITESFMHDPGHEMLTQAIPSGCFDVVMVGFNFLNSGARDNVLRLAGEYDVATQVMHAVRRALSHPEVLVDTVAGLIGTGEVLDALVNKNDPVGFLLEHPDINSVMEAAYRYCRHEPHVSVVLTGTGSKEHLRNNVEAINASPLPRDLVEKLDSIFGLVRSISAD